MSLEIRGTAPLLEVFDMPTSLSFYRDKLGFRVTGDSGQGDESGWVMLERDGVTIMLNTAYDDGERPDTPDQERLRYHHDTSIYFGCPDVDGAYEYLKSKDVPLGPPSVARYGMKQLYLPDPDNYTICFQWPHRDDEQ